MLQKYSEQKDDKPAITKGEELIEKYKKKRVSRLICLSDATGSMEPHWSAVRKILVELVQRISEMGQFEIHWVAYRDYDDKRTLIEKSGWQNTSQPLLNFINQIRCIGGADTPEAVEYALSIAANDDKATRIVLVGDAPPHSERDYKAQSKKLASLHRPVFSFVVGDDPDTVRTFKEISDITGGVSAKLTSINDILDLIAITIAEDIGGKSSVEEYLKKYDASRQLTSGGKDFAQKMLNKRNPQ